MKKLIVSGAAALLLLAAFAPRKKNKLKLPEEFVMIPAGTYYSASLQEDPYFLGLTKSKKEKEPSKINTISSFYISKCEISNLQYRQFYNEVSRGLTNEEKQIIACDTSGWQREITYGEPMVKHYFSHPAYNNYPAVNIPYEGALKYCQWLQQKLQTENPGFDIEVKLPEKNQWIYAAQGGRSNAMYPWGNYYLRNKKGEFLCNFKKLGDQSIVRDRNTGKPVVIEMNNGLGGGLNENAFYTAGIKSYYPNDYGLYNVCGNVAEMINEKGIAMGGSWNDYGGDVHIKAEIKFDGPAPTIGFRPVISIKEKLK
jgi:formylglycine-generating enzyme required for sulfatase activity